MYTEAVFEKIVLGHNPLFGVDHLSAERGRQREAHFANTKNLMQLIEWSVEAGATGMMMSTHERSLVIADELRANPKLNDRLRIYPLLPYAQKYVTAANEKGMLNVLFDMISNTTTSEKMRMFWGGAKTMLGGDIDNVLESLITLELKIFRGLNLHAVFLHDVFTDLILALELRDVAHFFVDTIRKHYSCSAAFATKNLPLFLEKMASWGIHDPLVMPHFNKLGFSMNPNRESCEQALRDYSCHVMAMSTLASGHLRPAEAYQYLAEVGGIESVVVGASSKSHVHETFDEIRRYL